MHLTRIILPVVIAGFARWVDERILRAFETINRLPSLTETQGTVVLLPLKLGGLGLRGIATAAAAAYVGVLTELAPYLHQRFDVSVASSVEEHDLGFGPSVQNLRQRHGIDVFVALDMLPADFPTRSKTRVQRVLSERMFKHEQLPRLCRIAHCGDLRPLEQIGRMQKLRRLSREFAYARVAQQSSAAGELAIATLLR